MTGDSKELRGTEGGGWNRRRREGGGGGREGRMEGERQTDRQIDRDGDENIGSNRKTETETTRHLLTDRKRNGKRSKDTAKIGPDKQETYSKRDRDR